MALQVLKISEAQVVANAMNVFTVPEDDTVSRVQQFINDVELSIAEPEGFNPMPELLEAIANELSQRPLELIFSTYIANAGSVAEVKAKMNIFFRSLLPTDDLEAYIRNLILPKFSATLSLSAGIDFPRNMLQPVDPITLEVIPVTDEQTGEPRAGFRFGEALFYVSTEEGVGYTLDIALTSTAPAMIGNTGLILEIERLKVDLSETTNIIEADNDGRPQSFRGVYAQYAAVTLPKKWFNDDGVVGGTTAKIAGYNLLIGTGGLSGTIALETQSFINSNGTITNYYTDYFEFVYPIQTQHRDGNGDLVITDIANHTALKSQLETEDNSQFVFPLSLTTVGGQTVTYESPLEYFNYVNTLYDQSDEANRPRLTKRIGQNGFEVWFTTFDITFKQGDIVNSNILGGLKIPKLKDSNGNIAEIDITGHLDSDGDFLITASEQDGFAPIEIPEVLKIHIQGVELGQEDGNFFIGTTADIEFTNPIMSKLLCSDEGTTTRIALPNVRIYSNGNFEIVGGGIPLPTDFGLCLGPVNMSITNLNFTSHQQEYNGVLREYKCWGFDGALNVNPLGVDVRGNGVKYCYTVDDDPANGKPSHSYIRISTIEVDLIIPGNASPDSATAIINGYVSIPEPGVSTEYAGGVSLKLPKVGVSGSVEMRVDPKYPAFILDANVEIPTPIPLAATGLGVFGFRGLLGYRYVAEKEAVGLTSGEDSWYDYYVYPERGINIDKFSGPSQTTNYKDPFSIGAGAAIATYGNDTIINFRVFLLLSIPSLFFIEGTANILAPQLGLDDVDEPPFFAFLAIGDNSIEAGLGADFKMPSASGDLLELRAKVEAGFFFNNPSAFYVNIGTKQDPITARVVSLITAQLYLQLAAKGIEAGARAELEFDKKAGPFRLRAYCYIEMGGKISFERPQLGAYFALGGEVLIDVKIVTVYIGLDILMGGEAPKPYLIYGEARICFKVKIVFFKIKFCGQVAFKWEKSREVDRTPIPPITEDRMLELAKGVHMLTGDAFDLNQLNFNITDGSYVPSANNNAFNNTVLPLDTYIDIKFGKAVDPTPVVSITGGVNNPPDNYIDLIPPQKTIRGKEVRQVKHVYSIEDVEIKAWNGSNWVDYNPYVALGPNAIEITNPPIDPTSFKLGHWQKPGKEYNALRILGDSPFSFTQLGEPGWYVPEQLGINAKTLFCQGSSLLPECANWLKKPTGVSYLANTDEGITSVESFFSAGRMGFWIQGPIFLDNLSEDYNASVVTDTNIFGFSKSLKVFNFMTVELRVPNPSNVIQLKLTTTGEGVTIGFYKSIIDDSSLTVQYELVEEVYKTRIQLAQEIVYENATQSISRVIVQPDFLDLEKINSLNNEIERIQSESYENFMNDPSNYGETEFVGASEADDLKLQIISLIQTGCAASIIGGQLNGGIGQMEIGTSFCVGMVDSVLENLDEYTSCTTLLHEVCWLSEVNYEYNTKIPTQTAIQEDFQLAEESVSKVIAPIWRPNTKYYMHLKLRDTVDNDASGTSKDYHYYYGFRTAGPLGHFHDASGVTYGLNSVTGETNRDGNGKLIAPDRFPLTNLARYIDYNRSYPNADGNLLNSKPLFYANQQAKLQLFFTRPQTYNMFNTWEAKNGFSELVSEMKVILKDPVNDILIPYPLPVNFDETTIPNTDGQWEDDLDPLVPEHTTFWNRMTRSTESCVTTGGGDIKPRTKKQTVTLINLKPQKLYTALVNNVFEGVVTEVHNYVFKTSRYANFEDQINSYILDDGEGNTKEAIFQIPLSLSTAEIETSLNIIDSDENKTNPNSQNDALKVRFADRFDRVVEGVWGISPLPKPESTEFNAVVDQNTGDTIALWIRNPEPFNDPKIPEEEVELGVNILNNVNDNVDSNYKILHSKDYSQLLIMRNNLRITNNALRVRFQYLLWNGSTYEVEDTVLVENLNIQ
ncbi:MAG: hypothetical protein ABJJ05_15230 [Maribacter litoralis]|uniref:hypothetical protein n=1 Tax=Maribacter litoralis TaxID=2059726 RepID=UPI003296F9F1